jgi:uncharacterized protein (DUF1330 family)
MPALQPTGDQLKSFMSDAYGGPVVMLNLLKFRDTAIYQPADPEHGETISGREAYQRYASALAAFVSEQHIGLEQVYFGPAMRFLIGSGDWDAVALARYPSRAHMGAMMQDPRYQLAHRHRAAGLLHQDLIETRPMER